MRDEQDYRSNPLYPAARSVTTFGMAPAWDSCVVIYKSARRLWELHQLENGRLRDSKKTAPAASSHGAEARIHEHPSSRCCMRERRDDQEHFLAPAVRSVTTFGLAPFWDSCVVIYKSARRLWELHQLEKRQKAARQKKDDAGE